MTTHYDDKGKIFTDIVQKKRIPVIIQTQTQSIHGIMHTRHDTRIKDALNSSKEQFFAVTDVVVYDSNGGELHRVDFLAINRDRIIWLIPEEEAEENETPHGDME
jgi:hypothetical protein